MSTMGAPLACLTPVLTLNALKEEATPGSPLLYIKHNSGYF